MTLQAVIFDMDGVLCSTDEYHYQSWKQVLQAWKIPFSRHLNENLRGLTRRRSLEVILGERPLPEEQVQAILEQKNRIFQELIREMTAADLLEGVAPLLVELRGAGVRVGVASASRNVQIVLDRLGIGEAIDAYCDGNSARRSKPAPDVYLAAAAALKVSPDACLAIEDSRAGIQAALAAGMCVVGLGPAERVNAAQAVYPDLSGVRFDDLRGVYARWKATAPAGHQSFSFP